MNLKTLFKKMREHQEPNEEFRERLRASLVIYMRHHPPANTVTLAKAGLPIMRWGRTLTISFAALAVFSTGTIGTVFAAQNALPGDALYRIKLAADQISVVVSNSPSIRMNVADRRLAEVKQVLAAQTVPTQRGASDIQSALAQYQTDLQGIMASIKTASSSSPLIAVQSIIQKTTNNATDLQYMLSSGAVTPITQDLKQSLALSRETVNAAYVVLQNRGDGTSPQNSVLVAASSTSSTTHQNNANPAFHTRHSSYKDVSGLKPVSSSSQEQLSGVLKTVISGAPTSTTSTWHGGESDDAGSNSERWTTATTTKPTTTSTSTKQIVIPSAPTSATSTWHGESDDAGSSSEKWTTAKPTTTSTSTKQIVIPSAPTSATSTSTWHGESDDAGSGN